MSHPKGEPVEARHLLKQLVDDDWYLGEADGGCRQYVHPDDAGIITVCVRFTDQLGPDTRSRATTPAEADCEGDPRIVVETTETGASAYSPDLSGCIATGTDQEEARQRMAEALALHRKSLRASG